MKEVICTATYITESKQKDLEKFFYNTGPTISATGAASLLLSQGLFRQHLLSYWNYILVSSEVYTVTSRHFRVWGFILFIMVRKQDTEFRSLA